MSKRKRRPQGNAKRKEHKQTPSPSVPLLKYKVLIAILCLTTVVGFLAAGLVVFHRAESENPQAAQGAEQASTEDLSLVPKDSYFEMLLNRNRWSQKSHHIQSHRKRSHL